MKQPTFNGRALLHLSVMEASHAGDAMAMERVLRYYEKSWDASLFGEPAGRSNSPLSDRRR